MASGKKIAPWEDIVLRLIAIYKILHGVFFIALGVGLLKLKHQDLPKFLNDYVIDPLQLPPESRYVDWALDEAAKITPHSMQLASDGLFVFALLFCIEGVGLYLRKQWAEYFVVIVSGSLLPVEIWTMIHKAEFWKLGVIFGNLLIVAYLVHRLRLDYTRRCEEAKNSDGPVDAASDPSAEERPVRNAH